jgi:hypothetical protein
MQTSRFSAAKGPMDTCENVVCSCNFVICTVKYTHTCALGRGFKLVKNIMAEGCYQNEGKLSVFVKPTDGSFTKIQDFLCSHLGVPYFHKAPIIGLYPTHKWFSRRTLEKKRVPLVIPSQTLVVFE